MSLGGRGPHVGVVLIAVFRCAWQEFEELFCETLRARRIVMLIDITRLLDRYLTGRLPTGVDRVSLAYIENFRARASALVRFAGRWLELSPRDSQRVFAALLNEGPGIDQTIRWCKLYSYVTAWRRADAGFLFNTGHSGLDLPDYAARLEHRGLKPLFFLHDLIPVSHPEYCRPGEAERHHRRLDTMLSLGAGLIVNSQATYEDLHQYADRIQRRVPPCVVAPLAPASLPQTTLPPPLLHPYFVVLGTIEPRKNHLLLLHLWRELVAEFGDLAPRLVVIGQRGWECEQVVDLLDRCEALRGFVIEKPRCDDATLANWLRHAQALLFPSFTEGFGMPLVESLMLQVPVIASDLPVFREIAGDIPEYLGPLDGLGWKQMLVQYMKKESPMRLRQFERMAGYKPPSWQGHFAIVEAFLRDLNGSA